MARISPEISTGSMADISFLLLTFFLLTSSIDTDQGITRKLPPPLDPKNPPPNIDIKQRNVLKVLVSKSRNDLSKQKFGVKFSDLSGQRSEAIAKAVPIAISEAEPENIGDK